MHDFTENELFDLALKHKDNALVLLLIEQLQRRAYVPGDYRRSDQYARWRRSGSLSL